MYTRWLKSMAIYVPISFKLGNCYFLNDEIAVYYYCNFFKDSCEYGNWEYEIFVEN